MGENAKSKQAMVSYIKRWLKRQGVDPREFDVEHLVDSSLSLEENLRFFKELVRRRQEEREEVFGDMMRAAVQLHESRSPRAREVDERRKAKVVVRVSGPVTRRKLRLLEKWMRDPSRLDVETIDG